MPRENVQSFLNKLKADPDQPVYERLAEIGEGMADRIEKLREAKGMTQKDLAMSMRTHQSRISLLEDPTYCGYTLETMVRLSISLECNITDLLTEPLASTATKPTGAASVKMSFASFSFSAGTRAVENLGMKIQCELLGVATKDLPSETKSTFAEVLLFKPRAEDEAVRA